MKIAGVILIGALAMSGAAFAQDTAAGRNVQAKDTCAPTDAAQLASAKGEVLLSRGAGFSEIKAGASLVSGDRLLVKQGGAELALGQNHVALGSNSMVTLVQKDDVLCAARLSSDPNTVAADLPARVRRDVVPYAAPYAAPVVAPSPVPYIIAGGGLATAFAAIMVNRGHDNAPVFVSP